MRDTDFCNRVRQLLSERNWSVYRLMVESGISRSTLYSCMSRRTVPCLDLVQDICDTLGVTLGEFFMDDDFVIASPDEESILELSEAEIISPPRQLPVGSPRYIAIDSKTAQILQTCRGLSQSQLEKLLEEAKKL